MKVLRDRLYTIPLLGMLAMPIPSKAAAVFAALLVAQPVLAQQLRQPQAAPPVAGPKLVQPSAALPPPAMFSDPSQRLPGTNPIPERGPAKEVLELPAVVKPLEDADANQAGPVVDRLGMPVRGALQVGPNRIFDPKTGRYHWTRPMPGGKQQKLDP